MEDVVEEPQQETVPPVEQQKQPEEEVKPQSVDGDEQQQQGEPMEEDISFTFNFTQQPLKTQLPPPVEKPESDKNSVIEIEEDDDDDCVFDDDDDDEMSPRITRPPSPMFNFGLSQAVSEPKSAPEPLVTAENTSSSEDSKLKKSDSEERERLLPAFQQPKVQEQMEEDKSDFAIRESQLIIPPSILDSDAYDVELDEQPDEDNEIRIIYSPKQKSEGNTVTQEMDSPQEKEEHPVTSSPKTPPTKKKQEEKKRKTYDRDENPTPSKRQKVEPQSELKKKPSMSKQMKEIEEKARAEARTPMKPARRAKSRTTQSSQISHEETVVRVRQTPVVRRRKPAKVAQVSNIFSGYVFMTTQIPDRDNVVSTIREHGGQYLDKKDLFASKDLLEGKKMILLSTTCSTTVVYLVALAIDVPLLNVSWLHECVSAGEIILPTDKHQLPCFVYKDRNPPEQTTQILPDSMQEFMEVFCYSNVLETRVFYQKSVYVAKEIEFKQDMVQLMRFAGATVHETLDKRAKYDFVLAKESSNISNIDSSVPRISSSQVRDAIKESEISVLEKYIPRTPSIPARVRARPAEKKATPVYAKPSVTPTHTSSSKRSSSSSNLVEEYGSGDEKLCFYYERRGERYFPGDPITISENNHKGILLGFSKGASGIECKYLILKSRYGMPERELLLSNQNGTVLAQFVSKLDTPLHKVKHSTEWYCIRRLVDSSIEKLEPREQTWSFTPEIPRGYLAYGAKQNPHYEWTEYTKLSYSSESRIEIESSCYYQLLLQNSNEHGPSLVAKINKIVSDDNSTDNKQYKIWLTKLAPSAKQSHILLVQPGSFIVPLESIQMVQPISVQEVSEKQMTSMKVENNSNLYYLLSE